MHSTIALSLVSGFALLSAAHPFPAKLIERGVCHFDDANPLVVARNAGNTKRQELSLTATRPSGTVGGALDEVWKHTEDTRPNDLDFANYGYDQIIAGKGKINYCA